MPLTGSTSILGMLRAARRKFASTSAPSIISALVRPSFAKLCCSATVLPSASEALSSTMMPPSLALAESACLSASTRTRFGRSMAWLRGVGPNERPPPRNRFTRAEPWRALPVPFCRYIFFPVRLISARFLTSWVPRWRLASCQVTQRSRMSARGLRPKIESDSVTSPAALPSSVVTFSSMSRPLLLGRGGGVLAFAGRRRLRLGSAEFAGRRDLFRQRPLDRVAYRDPAALAARNRAFDQDQTALDVGLHHSEIQRAHSLDSQVTSHLLVFERFSGVLPAAGRAVRAVRDRHAVGGAQSREIPSLHRAGEALADGDAGNINELADDEMIGGDLGADRNELLFADPELGHLALGLDPREREVAALGLADGVGLARAGAELDGNVTVLLLGTVRDHLAVGELQHRHRHVLAAIGKDARHPDLLCDDPGTHCPDPSRPSSLELDLDVDAGCQIKLHQRVHRLRRRIDDVEQPLVGAHLELLAALLVDVRRSVDGEFLDLGRQRNRAAHLSAGALGGSHDLAC